jgi:hypothetical protein
LTPDQLQDFHTHKDKFSKKTTQAFKLALAEAEDPEQSTKYAVSAFYSLNGEENEPEEGSKPIEMKKKANRRKSSPIVKKSKKHPNNADDMDMDDDDDVKKTEQSRKRRASDPGDGLAKKKRRDIDYSDEEDAVRDCHPIPLKFSH